MLNPHPIHCSMVGCSSLTDVYEHQWNGVRVPGSRVMVAVFDLRFLFPIETSRSSGFEAHENILGFQSFSPPKTPVKDLGSGPEMDDRYIGSFASLYIFRRHFLPQSYLLFF